MFSDLISDLGTGIGSLLPNFMKAFLDGFVKLFFTVTTAEGGATTITGISPVGDVALMFIVLGISYRFIPIIVGWLRLKALNRRSRRSRRAA